MNRKNKKTRTGIVVSDKMEKSVVVRVERMIQHSLYKRTMRRSKKYMAHDEANACKIGDTVRIIECKPISGKKNWRLLELVKSA